MFSIVSTFIAGYSNQCLGMAVGTTKVMKLALDDSDAIDQLQPQLLSS